MMAGTTQITYQSGKLNFTDDFAKRWNDEPLTKALGISSDIFYFLFPQAKSHWCVTAYDGVQPVGYVASNKLIDFINETKKNLILLKEKYFNDAKIIKYLNIIENVINFEETSSEIKQITDSMPPEVIVHSCGLLVLQEYTRQGIASELYRLREDLVWDCGCNVIIVETTNMISEKVVKKHGFKKLWSYDYREHGIDLEGEYAIWIKNLLKSGSRIY